MALVEGTTRDALGGIVIKSRMRKSPKRLDYELEFFRGVEVGLPGWERAHSQGKITGVESPDGIRYAPSEVNQVFQRLGVEGFIREILDIKSNEVDTWLTTVTYTHPGTLRLKEIQYKVDAVVRGQQYTLFEASIEVQDQKVNPRVTPNAIHRMDRDEWLDLISDAGIKRFKAFSEVINQWHKVKKQTSLYRGEHKMQLHLLERNLPGQFVMLFNGPKPELTIWDSTLESLNTAKIALHKRDLHTAMIYTTLAIAQYDIASKRYFTWTGGLDSSGKKAERTILVGAALAIIAACGGYVIAAEGAAVGAGATAGTGTTIVDAAQKLRFATENFGEFVRIVEPILPEAEAEALAEVEAAVETFAKRLFR